MFFTIHQQFNKLAILLIVFALSILLSPLSSISAAAYESSQPTPNEIWVDIPEDGRSERVDIEVVNRGTETWYDTDQFAFNYQYESGDSGSDQNRASRFYCSNWESDGYPNARVEYLRNAPVDPGETAEFRVWFCNPFGNNPTTSDNYPYTEHYALARGGVWVTDSSGNQVKFEANLRVTHQARNPDPSSSITVNVPQGGMSDSVTVTVENDGPTAWTNSTDVALNYQYEEDDSGSNGNTASKFYCDDWVSNHRPVYMQESYVPENQDATFTFNFCDPDPDNSPVGSSYTEHFAIAGGAVWMHSSSGRRRVLDVTFNIVPNQPEETIILDWTSQDFPGDNNPIPVPPSGDYSNITVTFNSVGTTHPNRSDLQLCLRKDHPNVSSPPTNDSYFRHTNWTAFNQTVEDDMVHWCIPGTPTGTGTGTSYVFSVDFSGNDTSPDTCTQSPTAPYCREDFGIVYNDNGTYKWVRSNNGRPIEGERKDANAWWHLAPEGPFSASFDPSNKYEHHTDKWPDHTFRRAQSLRVILDNIPANFSPNSAQLRWYLKHPKQLDFELIPYQSNWNIQEDTSSNLPNGKRVYEIDIPADAAIGGYTLTLQAELFPTTGERITLEEPLEFYVIFNPWSDEDMDVYNPAFNDIELEAYAKTETQSYYSVINGNTEFTLSPYSEEVFSTAIEEINGETSADVAIKKFITLTRYSSIDEEALPEVTSTKEFLDIRCNMKIFNYDGILAGDWCIRDIPSLNTTIIIPNLIKEWGDGNAHPLGQCHNFAALMTAFAQAVGVPSRMISCEGCGPIWERESGSIISLWDYHVWSEVWVNDVDSNYWSSADGTRGIGPVARTDEGIQDYVNAETATEMFAYDALTGGMSENLLEDYRTPSSLNLYSVQADASPHTITLSVGTNEPVYTFGDTTTIVVTATNNSASDALGDLQTSVSVENSSYTYNFHTYITRTIMIPAGETVTETYTLSQADYEQNGDFLVLADLTTVDGEFISSEGNFVINDGLDIQLTTPATIMVSEPAVVSLRVTNALSVAISEIDVAIYFPSSSNGVTDPTYFTIPSLAAGGVYTESWILSISHPGRQSVQVLASSPDAGYENVHAFFDALDYAKPIALVEVPDSVTPSIPFTVTAWVRNEGDLEATDVELALSLPSEIIASDPLTISVGNLAVGEEKSVVWSATALSAGVYPLQVRATETSIGDEELAYQLVPAVEEPHNIALTASQESIASSTPVTVTLNIENFGNIQDRVLLGAVSHNPNIGFTIFDNGTQVITGPVTVPALAGHELSLVIQPHDGEEGIITIKAISELDPNAVDYITIKVNLTEADFNAVPLIGTPPLTVTFTDHSTGTISSWLWSFGDGITSTLQHPTHIYTEVGTYTVTLTVDDPEGSDTLTRINYITATGPATAPSITSRYFLGGQLAPHEVLVDDIDDDNIQEIMAVIGGRVKASHPDGSQQWLSDLTSGAIRIEAAANLNCDGGKEILVVQQQQPGAAWLLDGQLGTIVWASEQFASKSLDAFAIPDVTGDGCSDLITYTTVGFQSRSMTLWSFDTELIATEVWTWNGNYNGPPQQIFVHDFDGDGEDDIFYKSGGQLALHDITDGSQKATLETSHGRSGIYIKDVDADAQPEVIILEDKGDIWTNHVGVFDIAPGTITSKWRTTAPWHVSQPLYDAVNDLDGNGTVEMVSGLYRYNGIAECANTWCLVIWQTDSDTPQASAYATNLYPMGVIDIDNDGFLELIAAETDTSDQLPDFSTVHVYDYEAGVMTEKWSLNDAGRAAYFPHNNNTQSFQWTYVPQAQMAAQNLDADDVMELYFFIDSNQDGITDELNAYDGSSGAQDASYTIPSETVVDLFYAGPLLASDSSESLIEFNTGELAVLDHNLAQQGSTIEGGGYWTGIPFSKNPSLYSHFVPLSADLEGDGRAEVLIDNSQGQVLNLDMSANPSVLNWEVSVSKEQELRMVADLDADGEQEVLVADESQNSVVLLAADGQTERWIGPDLGTQTVYHVGYGDANQTGSLDIFIQVVNEQNTNNNSIRALDGDTGEEIWTSIYHYPFAKRGLAIFDMNNDGCDDVVTTALWNDVAVVSGCDGEIIWRASWSSGSGIPFWATVANYDSDPYPELCVGGAYEASCWDNDADGLHDWWHRGASNNNQPVSIDLTGDGAAELIYWNSSSALQAISPGDSEPIWSIGLCHGAVTTTIEGRTCPLSAPVLSDINSDGQSEVLIGGLSDGYLYAINPLDGFLLWTYNFGNPVGNPTIGDTDGDGVMEIQVSVADGYVYVLDESQTSQVTLSLEPSTVTTGVGQTFELPILVEADTLSVDGVSAYLNFDPTYLEVVSITPGSDLPVELENGFDNASGQVNFSAGDLTAPFPSGTFTLATVTFEALAETSGSAIDFNTTFPRESNAVFDGTSLLNGTVGSTVIVHNAVLVGSVTLQGRSTPPNSDWIVPLNVSLTIPGESTPAYQFTPTTDENGSFTIVGIEPGTYEVRVKKSSALQNMQTVTLVGGSNNIDFGELREGDVNNDNFVSIVDFSLLAGSFAKCEGSSGFNEQADFNGDGCVTIIDFSLLASNFGQSGQSAPMTPNRASEVSLSDVSISIAPAQTSIEPGDVFNVTVRLDAGEQQVDGAQIGLNFDPDVLAVEEVVMGDKLALELANQVVSEGGSIQFAAGTLQEFPSGEIDVMAIQFRALKEGEAALAFSVDGAMASDVTFGGASVLGQLADGVVVVSEPTAVRVIELAAPATAGWLWALAPLALTMLAGAWIVRRRR